MTVTTPRSTVIDVVRSVLVALLAVAQVVVAALGGSGALGDGIGAVANANATPLLAAGWAFVIWTPIYLGFLACAGYGLLPRQRVRAVHRRTGWWLAATAVLNPLWIVAFGNRHLVLADVVLFALLGCLAMLFGRLGAIPAEGAAERVLLHGTVAVYTGWVALAAVLGTAAAGVSVGLPGDGALADAAAVIALVAAAVVAGWVVGTGTAIAGFAAAVVWALAGIAANDRPVAVTVTAALAAVFVAAVTIRRVRRSVQPARLAWG